MLAEASHADPSSADCRFALPISLLDRHLEHCCTVSSPDRVSVAEGRAYIDQGAPLLEKMAECFLHRVRLKFPRDRPVPPGQKYGRVPLKGFRRIGRIG